MKKTLRERLNDSRAKRVMSEGYQTPKSELEIGLSTEWGKSVKGAKFEVEIVGNYDINDYDVYAYGDELGVYKLYYELSRVFSKVISSDITIDVGYSKSLKKHYLVFRNYGML